MHRGRIELVLDALEVIEPLDRAVEFGAFLLGQLSSISAIWFGEPGPIEFLEQVATSASTVRPLSETRPGRRAR